MNIKQLIKRSLEFVFNKRPLLVTAQIVTLQSSDLLHNRFALITGGASGIGFAIAESFLKAGAIVCITGRNEEKLNIAVCQLQKMNTNFHDRIFYLTLDNRDVLNFPEKIHSITQQVGRKIDILVNNAGVLGGNISNTSESEYDQVLDTNLKGVFFFLSIWVGICVTMELRVIF